MVYNLVIPAIHGDPYTFSIQEGKSLVFVGANGSGKSRLGCFLERQLPKSVHRIPAHKSLSFPETVSPGNFEDDKIELLYGRKGDANNKIVWKYQQNPETHFLNDYSRLVKALVSQSTETAIAHLNNHRTDPTAAPPSTIMMKLCSVWERVLPHRRLKEVSGGIKVIDPEDIENDYAATALSDGERAIFYFIGQSLLAPEQGLIIVDEPELHIHKAILKKLWDEIEAARQDCVFIYITHDLDFAKSRSACQKFSIQKYSANKWEIVPIAENDEFPEEIITKILGSRHSILFVEGTGASIDINVYSKIYPDFTVIPLGCAEDVIHAVASFNKNTSLHRMQCAGIIDKDDREDTTIKELEEKNIHVLPVSEIENILLYEEVLEIVARQLRYSPEDTAKKISEAKTIAFEQAKKTADSCALTFVKRRLDNAVKKINLAGKTITELNDSIAAIPQIINPQTLYDERVAILEKYVTDQNYSSLVEIYDKKGLASLVGAAFGFKSGEYIEFILRHLNSSEGNEFLIFLSSKLPKIPTAEISATKKEAAAAAKKIVQG